MTKTAIIYARVSTTRQAEKQLPVESQLSQARKKAEALGATVAREFVDRGVSGTLQSRPAFQDAILYCEIHRPDYFIVWSSSRFARNKHDATSYKLQLQRLGVVLCYVFMDVDTDSDQGWAMDSMLEVFDELYSRQVSADTRRSMSKVAADGYWTGGCAPHGYQPVAVPGTRRKKLAVNEAEADVVRLIFRLKSVDRMGCRQIANYLNENGYANRGRPWRKTIIGDLLRNPNMIGQSVFGRKDRNTGRRRPLSECLVVDSHPPIIDRSVWDAVQEQLQKETNNTDNSTAKSHFLLTGLLKCACGASCRTENANGRRKRYWYYNCRAAAEDKAHRSNRISAPALDAEVIRAITEKMITEESVAELIDELQAQADRWGYDQVKRKKAVSNEILGVERKLNRLYEALEESDGALTLQDIAPRIRRHKSDLERLGQRLRDIESETPPRYEFSGVTPESVRARICERIAADSPRKVRGFLKTFVEKVQIVDECLEISYHAGRLVGSGGNDRGDRGSPHVRGGEPISEKTNRRVLTVRLPSHLRRAA